MISIHGERAYVQSVPDPRLTQFWQTGLPWSHLILRRRHSLHESVIFCLLAPPENSFWDPGGVVLSEDLFLSSEKSMFQGCLYGAPMTDRSVWRRSSSLRWKSAVVGIWFDKEGQKRITFVGRGRLGPVFLTRGPLVSGCFSRKGHKTHVTKLRQLAQSKKKSR